MNQPDPVIPTAPPPPQPAAVLRIVAEVARELRPHDPAREPELDSSLERDLAFDSLGRVELMARLERAFDRSMPEDTLTTAETPRDLLAALLRGVSGAWSPAAVADDAVPDESPVVGAPASAQTLIEVLQWHVHNHPDRVHIQHEDDTSGDAETISYRRLWDEAARVAGGLQAYDVRPGDRVALMLPTGNDYFYAFFAILMAGAVPVPIYPPVRRSQLEDHLRRQGAVLQNCAACLLITVAEARTVAALLTARVPGLRHVVTCDDLAGADALPAPVSVGASDIGFVQYTSGSTGDPKGVVLTHANLLANIRGDGRALAADSSDVFVSWLPLYHDMGLIGAWFGSLYHAVRLVIMSPLVFLGNPARWLWAIDRYGGTLSAAPNFAYELCLRRIADADIEGLDLSRWRLALNGAEPISADTLDAFCARFGKYGFRRNAMFPVYGLAECSVGLTFPPVGRELLIDRVERAALSRHQIARPAADDARDALRIVACGRPLPGHEVRVVDRGGHELPERQVGELQFRGPSATAGYYRSAEHTRQLFDGDWLRTGDRAYIAGGDLYLAGRSKEMIIRAGRNIYPAELEQAIGELDGIRRGRVVVFGTSDAANGTERLVVLAETRREPAAHAQLREAINALAATLVDAAPDDIVLAPPDTILKTSSGKLRRVACRERYESGTLSRAPRALWLQIARLALSGATGYARGVLRRGATVAFGVYALACLALIAPAGWLAVMVLPRQPWRWSAARALLRLLSVLTRVRVSVRGLENLPPAGVPCVLVCNHQSYLDAFVLVAALPRAPVFLAKAELLESPLTAWPLRRLGTRFVRRNQTGAGLDSMAQAGAELCAGNALTIFAEGTFKRMPGLLPFYLGAFSIAVEAGVAVVPVTLRGTRSILRAGTALPRRGRIVVTVSAPITPSGTGDNWAAALALRDATRAQMLRHCAEPDLEHESNRVDG